MGNRILKVRFHTRVRLFLAVGCSALAVSLITCGKSEQKRSFSEVKGFDSPVQSQEIMLPDNYGRAESPRGPGDGHDHSMPSGRLNWVLPKGWQAHVGSGMYYAIVKTSVGPEAGEIGIIALPGEAGGLKANAERWLGQLGLQLPASGLESFLAGCERIKTRGDLELTVLDYTTLVKEDDGTGMLVGITKPGEHSYFIKWTGRKSDLAREKENFLAFVGSLGFQ